MNLFSEIFKNPFYRFILIAVLCYVAWFSLYDLWLKPAGTLDTFLGDTTANLVVKIMNWMNYDFNFKPVLSLHYFYNNGERVLKMVPACNGQVLYPLFIGFIIATPGLLKDKILVTLAGCVIIFFVNTMRVLALCLVKIHSPQYLAFNHKYTFTVVVYGCIFIMWLIWINVFVVKVRRHE